MSDGTKISWSDATWPVAAGCEHVSDGCEHCLVPETRVLRADMTWVPVEDIQVGDKLVSFTESPAIGQNRTWEEAVVEAKWETVKPIIEVELANGTRFTASEDHRWLIAQRGHDNWWRQTLSLNFKTSVRAIRCEPTDTKSASYRAGYIAGATAGDGTFRWDPSWRSDKAGDPQSYWRVAKPESDRIVLDRLAEYLRDFGVVVEIRPFDSGTSGFTGSSLPMAKVETRKLANMPVIAAISEEKDAPPDWMAGYLAGMFDTDASYCGGSLRFCQAKPNDVLDRVVRYAKELGFDVQPEHYDGAACPTARLMGGIAENIGFLAAVSPALTRRCRDFYGKRLETPASRVIGIRRGYPRRLIDITTSTGTFIAEGALTHNCYAAKLTSGRLKHLPAYSGLAENGRFSGQIRLLPDRLDWPSKWRKPRKIFVADMSDLFYQRVPDKYIARVWQVMATNPRHTFQVLTKRHARMRAWVNRCAVSPGGWITHDGTDPAGAYDGTGVIVGYPDPGPRPPGWGTGRRGGKPRHKAQPVAFGWPLPNVWCGVSAEDQHWADIRIPALLDTPAAVRFVSAEPLLGPIDLRVHLAGHCPEHDYFPGGFCVQRDHCDVQHLSWVIVGGESGPGHRPMDIAWLESIVSQCKDAGVAVWVKQDSGPRAGQQGRIPDDLWIHEFPVAAELAGAK
jgi:protein gp37